MSKYIQTKIMEVNEINKGLYDSAFIENGEFGYHGATWKPDIDEREIQEYCEDEEGNYKPATPLGYRDYGESRLIGIKNILDQYPAVDLTNDKFHHLKREEAGIKRYDKIKTDVGDFIVTGDDETNYYVVNLEGKLFSVEYESKI